MKKLYIPAIILFLIIITKVSFSQTISVTYTYDNLHQLTKATYSNGIAITYNYDKLGNRTSVVTTTSNQGYTVNGQVSYSKPSGAVGLKNMAIRLVNSSGSVEQTTNTDVNGSYSFSNVQQGTYTIQPGTNIQWSNAAVTSYDLYLYQRHITGVATLGTFYVLAGDVNKSSSTTSYDLYLIQNRILGNSSSFASGDWVFENPSVTISGSNLTKNINALLFGDANGSYTQQ